jgi:hypothetical protein
MLARRLVTVRRSEVAGMPLILPRNRRGGPTRRRPWPRCEARFTLPRRERRWQARIRPQTRHHIPWPAAHRQRRVRIQERWDGGPGELLCRPARGKGIRRWRLEPVAGWPERRRVVSTRQVAVVPMSSGFLRSRWLRGARLVQDCRHGRMPPPLPRRRHTAAGSNERRARCSPTFPKLVRFANVPKHVPQANENGPQRNLRGPFRLVAGTGFEPATSGL